jgi:cytochrome P450
MTLELALEDDLLAPGPTEDPYPVLAALRREDPVHWSASHRAWLLTRYEDVSNAFTDPRLSSQRVGPLLEALDDHRRARLAPVLNTMIDWMVLSDPPAHDRLRRLANNAFKQQRVNAMGEQIERLVDELLHDFVTSGHRDLITHFAYPLPATVIGQLLGAPIADRDLFRAWSDELALVAFGVGGDDRPDRHERALRGLEEMLGYFRSLAERARETPGDDIVSLLLERDESGDGLDEDELTGMCALLLFAGHETTSNLIANGVLTLLRHPEQLALVRANPRLINTAVEELLRYDGPVKIITRWVLEDLEIGGRRIRAGDRVFLVLAAANRDPERFDDPDRLDVARQPNLHIGFGRGIHTCIGAQLARIEMRIALRKLLERFPKLRLADENLSWQSTLASRALRELRVEHDGL